MQGTSRADGGTGKGRRSEEPGGLEIDYQGLWVTLAKTAWRSLVLVPADADGTSVDVAIALADAGRRLTPDPVTFLLVSGPFDAVATEGVIAAITNGNAQTDGPLPKGKVIVSVPPLAVDARAMRMVTSADAVALCLRQGRTRLSDAVRTVEAIGRDRLIGCILR